MQINQPALDFELYDRQGDLHALNAYRGKIVIVNFWSAECVHSERTDRWIVSQFAEWGSDVELLPIAANANESPESVDQAVLARGIPRVLIDTGHIVADRYEVICTPQIFLIDRDGILRYRGAVDDVAFRQKIATRNYLQEAVEALMQGRLPDVTGTPAYGCALVREI
jgi:peroxiredoxin